jgi:hypothetical protein
MTLAEAGEIFAYWADHPPPHLLLQAIAGALGWRPPAPADTSRLAEAPPPGLVVAPGPAAGTPAPVFALDELRSRNRARAAATAQRNAAL